MRRGAFCLFQSLIAARDAAIAAMDAIEGVEE
jgi:hypothetical protein